MNFEKMKLFFARHKALTIVLSLVAICAICYGIRSLYCFYYHNNPGTTISVFGAIFGAIVGGIFTLWGSIIINNREQKKANAIRRKNKIYEPLYNELMVIHNEILKNNPCPSLIDFEKRLQTILKHPQYIVWGEIKNDARYFEVPSELNEAMEKLYGAIEKYQEKQKPALDALSTIYFNDKMIKQLTNNSKRPICDFTSLFSGVLLDKRPGNDKLIKNCPDISMLDTLWNNIIKMAENSPMLKECKEARSDWNAAEENALKLLDKLIKDIVNKYEK